MQRCKYLIKFVPQIELIKRRDADLSKVRHELEETILQHDLDVSTLKKRQQDVVTELMEQVENLTRVKGKIEKERSQMSMELYDATSQLEEVTKIKARAEANLRVAEEQTIDLRVKCEENSRAVNELTIVKNRLQSEAADNYALLEEAESKASDLYVPFELPFIKVKL